MSDKAVTTFWAGYIAGKLHCEDIDDGFGGWGQGWTKSPRLFTTRAEARKQFEDVRKVKIVEVR